MKLHRDSDRMSLLADRMKWFATNLHVLPRINRDDFDMLNTAFTVIENNLGEVPEEDYKMLEEIMDVFEMKYKT